VQRCVSLLATVAKVIKSFYRL